jgi:hypothetical protein
MCIILDLQIEDVALFSQFTIDPSVKYCDKLATLQVNTL